MLICFTTPCHNMIIILRQLPYSGYKSNIIVHENTPNQANVPSALIHLFICFFAVSKYNHGSKRAAAVKIKRRSLILFCFLMGLRSTFLLAGLQTTTAHFNKSGLSYINT